MLLAADASIADLRTRGHRGSTGQEAYGGVTRAAVPQQHSDECEEGADNDEGLVVHPSSQAAHYHNLPVQHKQKQLIRRLSLESE